MSRPVSPGPPGPPGDPPRPVRFARPSAPMPTCNADLSITCPTCNMLMQPEHAHYKCPRCGYRDSCCF